MQVFKLCMKIFNQYKGIILLYTGIFMSMALIMTLNTSKDSGEETFETDAITVIMIDRDKKNFNKALQSYFGDKVIWKEMDEDEARITEELYWKKAEFVLTIPKGFEDSLQEETPMELYSMKVPNYTGSVYFETELKQYLQKLQGLCATGMDVAEAMEELESLQGEEVTVELAAFKNENQNDRICVFFRFVPYLFLSVCISGIGLLLSSLNNTEVRQRMECGAHPLGKRKTGEVAAVFVFGMLLYGVVFAMAMLLSDKGIFTDVRVPWFALNIFNMLLLSISFGLMTGTIAKSRDSINGLTNVIGLTLCFFGGIFVPKYLFSEGVDFVARFTPTYWYTNINEEVGGLKEVTPEFVKSFFMQTGIILGYTLIIFGITLFWVNKKRRRA